MLTNCQIKKTEQIKTETDENDTVNQACKPIENLSGWLQPVAPSAFFGHPDYYTWGASVVKGEDGHYHMFYARWKKAYKFEAWVTHSEIAHAVADHPAGPFKFRDVTLPPRGSTYWDGLTTHNPTVHKFNGRYYLYYMGTTGDGKVTKGLNFVHRNNQRIGVAWARDPNGPWTRSDHPLIDISKDSTADDALMVSNPSVTVMQDGKILMIYKAVARRHALPFGGPVTHLAAISNSPLGPFRKINKRIFYKEGEKFPSEDPYIWYSVQENIYYAIVKDNFGTFTRHGKGLVMFKSKNGLDWNVADEPLVSKIELRGQDGLIENVTRLERPQVLFEDGIPVVLYCAVAFGDPNQHLTKNVHIPLIAP
jgi:hypothetical protein